MTHFHDATIKQALLDIAPADEAAIGKAHFGEITGS